MPEEYSYIAMIDRLSDGDVTKHEEIYKMNWRSILYIMSYWAVKDKVMTNK